MRIEVLDSILCFVELLFQKAHVTYVLKLLYVKVFSPIIKSESLIILKSLYLLFKLQFSEQLIKYHCKSDFHLFIKVGHIKSFFKSQLIRLSLERRDIFFKYNIIIHFHTFTHIVGIFNNFSSKIHNFFIRKPFLELPFF